METVRILLVETKTILIETLRRRLSENPHEHFAVDALTPRQCREKLSIDGFLYDVVLLGDELSEREIVKLARLIREHDELIPLIALTKIRDAVVPPNLSKAGIEEMLNIAELKSPLFSWTFMSLLKQSAVRKKAGEFREIRRRLGQINGDLASLIHDLNNPLHALRLAIHSFGQRYRNGDRPREVLTILDNGLTRVEAQVKKLSEVRDLLGEQEFLLAKVSPLPTTPGDRRARTRTRRALKKQSSRR